VLISTSSQQVSNQPNPFTAKDAKSAKEIKNEEFSSSFAPFVDEGPG
jgi:hypothetical protein